MTKEFLVEVKGIASGYFARCDGIEKCFPQFRCNFRQHGHFPGAVFFAPYGFSWKDSFASEWSAVQSLCRFLSKATGARFWPKKAGPGLWFIQGTRLKEEC